MKRLLDYGNAYAKSSTWQDFALVKFCVCALGVIIGCLIPAKWHKKVLAASGIICLIAYLPLVGRLVSLFRSQRQNNETTEDAIS